MKLIYGEALADFAKAPFAVVPSNSDPVRIELNDPKRRFILMPIEKAMHSAERFIFDSGSDQEERLVTAVRETAFNMLDAGIFHLPHRVCWIEDPFDGGDSRNIYLCEEHQDEIRVILLQRFNGPARGVRYMLHLAQMVISLTEPSDEFQVRWTTGAVAPLQERTYREAVYSLKKFLVTLNTAQVVRERVIPPGKNKPSVPVAVRSYPHTIIRVPTSRVEVVEKDGTRRIAERPLELVSGYTWGKNTRPIEEQRWVFAYYRGNEEFGVKPSKPTLVVPRDLAPVDGSPEG